MTNKSPFVEYSDLFGILEGKRKARIEEEKRKTKELEAELFIKTAETRALESEEERKLIELQNKSKTSMYITVAIILVIVMAGLYYIVKSK